MQRLRNEFWTKILNSLNRNKTSTYVVMLIDRHIQIIHHFYHKKNAIGMQNSRYALNPTCIRLARR